MPRKKKNKISKKKLVISLFFTVFCFFVIYLMIPKKKEIEYATVVAKKNNIEQTVSETGVVKLPKKVDLNFSQSGKVHELLINVGRVVKVGDLLARLNNDSLKIKERELLASLEIAKINLSKLISGATKNDIAVSEANLSSAITAFDAAKNELEKIKASASINNAQNEKILNDLWSSDKNNVTAYEQAIELAELNLENTRITYRKSIEDSVNNGLIDVDVKLSLANVAHDNILKIIDDSEIKSVLSIKNPVFLDVVKLERIRAVNLVFEAREFLTKVQSSNNSDQAEVALERAKEALKLTLSALRNCFNALENTLISASFTQTQLDAYKAEINTQIGIISAGISSLTLKEQIYSSALISFNTSISSASEELERARVNYNDALLVAENALLSSKSSGEQQIQVAQSRVEAAEKALKVAQVNLNKVKAPANEYDVVLAKIQVDQAKAALDYVRQQIKDTEIVAPFSGTVSRINFEVGEFMSANQNAITLLGDSNFEIEVLVSEIDIFKVKKGNKVNITLDALGDDVVFVGKVDFIEPAETRIQDVIYYKVKIIFESNGSLLEVKHGMTANLDIMTSFKSNVIALPGRAVLDGNGMGRYVRILVDNNIVERNVILGLKGDGGMVEIMRGVELGDEVVLYVKK